MILGDKHNKKNESDVLYLGMFLAGFLFLGRLLLGGLVGTITTLLLAPQCKKTRKQIRRKGRDLRVHTTDTLEDGVSQVRAKAQQVTARVHEQAEGLQHAARMYLTTAKSVCLWLLRPGKRPLTAHIQFESRSNLQDWTCLISERPEQNMNVNENDIHPKRLPLIWKLPLIGNRTRGWWHDLRHKPATTEEMAAADHASMVWADDGGRINPIPTNGAGET